MKLRSKLAAAGAALALSMGLAAVAAPASAAVLAINVNGVHDAQNSMITVQGAVAAANSGGVSNNSSNSATADALNNVASVTENNNVDGWLLGLNATSDTIRQSSTFTGQLAAAQATANYGVTNASTQAATAVTGNNLAVTSLNITVH